MDVRDLQLVVFRCRSCEFSNKMDRRGADRRKMTFENLTEAIGHLVANPGHDIVAIVEPEDRR